MPIKTKKTDPINVNAPSGRDLFQTPNYAVELLIPFIPKHINHVWECAAGNLKISNVFKSHSYGVTSSDIRPAIGVHTFNFLTEKVIPAAYNLAIVTNPPYSLKKQFFMKCMEYGCAFALLIPADYCGWVIEAIDKYGCEKIIPTRRIDYITPSGLSGKTGNTSNFHSLWLTRRFGLGKSETFVELTKEMKENE